MNKIFSVNDNNQYNFMSKSRFILKSTNIDNKDIVYEKIKCKILTIGSFPNGAQGFQRQLNRIMRTTLL